jgi:RNA polymerase-binding protein DksA
VAKASKKKSASKKPEKKAAKPAKAAAKAPAKSAKTKPVAAKSTAKGEKPTKPAQKAAPESKAEAKSPAKPAPAPAPVAPSATDDKKAGPKGITIVQPKPLKKSKPKPKAVMPVAEPLLKPGQKWKPLIPSGPKAPGPSAALVAATDEMKAKAPKMPKRDLEKYKAILIRKRAELVGDISNMEEEALRTNSGSLSSLPQHMAEQGSDTFEQSLSLDLAQVDRNLLREIDAALKRIEDGTYGICELTGKPIPAERLEELPWARYSIEAARELEKRPVYVPSSSSALSGSSSSSSGDE